MPVLEETSDIKRLKLNMINYGFRANVDLILNISKYVLEFVLDNF